VVVESNVSESMPMRLLLVFLMLGLVGCTTVNVYTPEPTTTVIVKPNVRNMDNPYLKK
jgi:hypothetical protein